MILFNEWMDGYMNKQNVQIWKTLQTLFEMIFHLWWKEGFKYLFFLLMLKLFSQ